MIDERDKSDQTSHNQSYVESEMAKSQPSSSDTKPEDTPRKTSIVFFGSGPVAAESLELLLRHQQVEAVITKPSTVKTMKTVAKDVPIFSVSSKSELDELMHSNPFKSSLGVLIDFGIIVSREVIDSFQLGILNSHFSVLPELRGADPITFAILSGQDTTGVSLMLLVEAMDEGPLIGYGEEPLKGSETGPVLTKKLILLSDALLEHNLPRIFSNKATSVPQDITGRSVSYTRKLTKADGVIDWTKPAQQIEREIRAYIDWPKSRTTIAKKDVVILEADVIKESGNPGDMAQRDKELIIYCGSGALSVKKLKPAGKKEMSIEAFLAGYKI